MNDLKVTLLAQLDQLEEIFLDSSRMPFTGSRLVNEEDAIAILSDYKKRNPNLVKLYESLFERSWDKFYQLPICMFPEIK